ncbi:16S rRNA (uracil(1498)-N(3))-methyltransferase [Candidatus Gracilibacteria bacterium]|nr:16S rRNA (uracil(1498)-N(3))-methyltransferase [Candidatus Gracilibacteria bacterium]
MQRFYIQDIKLGEDFSLKKAHEIYHQLTKVLRSLAGDKVIFFDGEDLIDFDYEISYISGSELVFKYIGKTEKNSENSFGLSLYQAMPSKLSKLEYIVQKGVETGYAKFVFFKSERSQKLVLSDKKIERLQKIIIEAAEQSERNRIPKLVIQDKASFPEGRDGNLNIVFHTADQNSSALKDINLGIQNINIFVGPEGGFSTAEAERFESLGYKKSYLGDRILRCETVSSVVGFFISQSLS